MNKNDDKNKVEQKAVQHKGVPETPEVAKCFTDAFFIEDLSFNEVDNFNDNIIVPSPSDVSPSPSDVSPKITSIKDIIGEV